MDTDFGVFMRTKNNGQLAMIVSYKNRTMANEMRNSLNKDNKRLHMHFFVCPIVDDEDK